MNFFSDNPDLQFIFETADLAEIIAGYEEGFTQAARYDYAPESSEDARDSYRRTLETAGAIAADIIAPRAEAIDREPHTLENGCVTCSAPLQECLQALRQADLMGCCLSRRWGGLNLPNMVFIMLVEIISRAEAGIQNIFGLQGIGGIIEAFAKEHLKERYLPQFADGTVTGAMALTEEDAGSDLQNIKMKAEEQPDGTWRLSGVKRFITNGGAEVQLVLARSEPGTTDGLGLSLFLCEKDETVRVRRLEDKLGIHGSPTCEVTYQDTPARLIGERQRGLVTYVLALLGGARLATAAQAVGISQAAFDEARSYARVRRQYGRRIEMLPPVAEMLTGMKVSIEACRALTCETARIMDLSVTAARKLAAGDLDPAEKKQLRKDAKSHERLTMLLTSCAKYYCSEQSIRITGEAMQVLGGSGYMRDYPLEKYYRDARITSIYEGTSQMQIVSAFRAVLGGTMEKHYEELANSEFPRRLLPTARKLERARVLLGTCVEKINSYRDNSLRDLCSRPLVDMATDILIGYLLLHQAQHSTRKLEVAKLFAGRIEALLKQNAHRILHANTACLKHYDSIVGPPMKSS